MAEPGAVVAAISDQMFGLRQCDEHEASAPIVTHLAFRQEMIGRRPLPDHKITRVDELLPWRWKA